MAGRKVRDEAEAVALVREARRLGVAPSQVAMARGIDGRSMNAWRMTLDRTGRAETMLELVPVSSATSAVYRICYGELVVEVADDFDEHTLGRLLGVVQAC